MTKNTEHKKFLLQALELAKIHRGFCAPNPAVGAVIVDNIGAVLATGYHLGPGFPHAEIDAIHKVDLIPENSTIYISLEPCSHFGRTPPCTNAIIKSGITNVVYAYNDPNPIVCSKSKALLEAAGITCEYYPLPEINKFYESYFHWTKTNTPFINAKIAITLDGKIAGKNREPIKITSDEMNQFTHRQRKNHDAILSTIETIIADDPRLNVRCDGSTFSKPLYILDSQLRLPLDAKIFSTSKSITLFHMHDAPNQNREKLMHRGARCIEVESASHGLDLTQIVNLIGSDGIQDLWIEAGGKCFSSFLEMRLLNKAFIYIAPRLLGEGVAAFGSNFQFDFASQQIRWEQIGRDVLCEINW